MDALTVPVILDRLDDETACFTGAETEEYERATLFGAQLFRGKFPTVWIQRDAWTAMGCPTALMVTLETVTVNDSPPV